MLIQDFNPRSHKGSDGFEKGRTWARIYFNPRSHKGSDTAINGSLLDYAISIHAPTRGATKPLAQPGQFPGFQSTLPQGERLLPVLLIVINFDISIHAPTRGATDIPGHIHILCGFQSTLPQGERQDTVVTNKPILVISIHAPTRGATPVS